MKACSVGCKKRDEELKGLRKRRPLLIPPPHEQALTFAMQFIWKALQEFQQSTSREFLTLDRVAETPAP